jgi:probable HAF family extracellular repeat protein
MRQWLVLVALLFAVPAHGAHFESLGDLPGGTFESSALGISADGSTVVGTSASASGNEAVRWTNSSGLVGLGTLPNGAFPTTAQGVSADGSVVVGFVTATSSLGIGKAFRWTSADGMDALRDPITGEEIDDCGAAGVSADGSTVVGGSMNSLGARAFRWTRGDGMVDLGALAIDQDGFGWSEGYGISADGSVVVGSSISGPVNEAFIWTSTSIGGMVGLGDLPGGDDEGGFSLRTGAHGISADGSTVVGSSIGASGLEAFIWTSTGGMVGLGDLPGGLFRSAAWGVSPDGSTVVGEGTNASGPATFIWNEVDGMRDLAMLLTSQGLDLSGWTLSSATGIAADNRTIVGRGVNPSGKPEAWLAVVPEPDASLLGMTGVLSVLGLAASRRRRAAN